MDASSAAGDPAQALAAWHDDLPRTAERWAPIPKVAQLVADNSRRWWRNSRLALNSVLTIAYFDRLGMPRLT